MILLRTTESPKFNRADVDARFPGYTVFGSKQGWFYPIEETKCVLMSVGFKSLVDDVRQHMKVNGVEVPANLMDTIQFWWCDNIDSENCGEPVPAHAADIYTLAMRFLRTVRDWLAQGGQRVPQDEAERRAAICATCPFNQAETWCSGCFMKAVLGRVLSAFGGWTTSRDAELKSCRVCGCKLSVKVHIPAEAMEYKGLEWPEHCWMNPPKSDQSQPSTPEAE